MAKYSIEKLYHFKCDHCGAWWTVGDWQEQDSEEIHCIKCGTKQSVEPLPPEPDRSELSVFERPFVITDPKAVEMLMEAFAKEPEVITRPKRDLKANEEEGLQLLAKILKRCRKCGGEMKEGKAMQSTLTSGAPDFPDSDVVTVSPGGPGKLVDCWKCCECGWSVSK